MRTKFYCLVRSALSAFLLAAIFVLPASAQEARGTITGHVKDNTGAVVPNAKVVITNVAMGTTTTLTSNDTGYYQAPYLLPGTYQITVEMKGFKKYIRDGVILRVNDNIEIDLALEIGDVGETVTVTADAPLLDTTSGSMGQVIDSRRVAELPIPHGDPFKLIGLAAGVSFSRDLRLDRPFEPTHIVGYSIDGTRANRSDVMIDGVPSTSTANAGEVIASFVPPQDLVQEFKVQTATFDAQFGNTEGGVTNISIKSGTNSLHGTAYWTKMAPSLFANDFFANKARQPLADFTYDRWGGTVGGPVWLPKLYNGKNKTFFMYGIEGIPESRPRNNGTPTIPSERMRSGDFSELLTANVGYQLYNPFSARSETGGRIRRDPFYCDAAGNPTALNANKTQVVGTPCNKIPTALINPIARKFVDTYLPKPTTTGAADGTGNFAQPDLLENIKYLSNTIRIDHVFNEKHRVFGRASWYNRDSDYNNYYRNIATGDVFLFKSRQGTFDHVWAISPTMVLNSRYGYNRFIRGTDSNPGNRGFDLTSLGFPSYYNSLIPEDIRRFPRFNINGYQGTSVGGELRPTDTHSFNSTMNQTFGTHAVKYGLEFRSYRETDKFFGNNQTGQFDFGSNWTRGPLDNVTPPTDLGFSFASFLLGLPTGGSITIPADYAEQSTTTGVFIHDDWRVSPKLTLNIGLRYEVEGALTERFNKSVRGFDLFANQPMEAAVKANLARTPVPGVDINQFFVRGGLTFAGVNGEPRGLYKTPRNNYMPRFGFAYKLTEKTVVRGGYGIFYGFLGQRRGDVNQIGFSTVVPLNITLNNGLTFLETLNNPFETYRNGLPAAPGASLGAQTFLGQGISFFNPRPLSPYNQRWELSLQRELPGGFAGDIAYVGNRGTHAEITRNINALPNQYLSTSTTRDNTTNSYLGALVANPFAGQMPASAPAGFRSATIARSQLLRPFPQFGDINTTNNDGYSWYHALQANLNKRFGQGYTIGMSYTWSKFMEAISYLNAADPLPTEVISDFDRTHRFTMNGIYELPFGKNRRFLANVNRFGSYFISGWQISGIYQYQSGAPINFGNIFFTGRFDDIPLPSDQRTTDRWFNTAAGFVTAANAQPVSNVRTFPLRLSNVRTHPINNIDLSIIKKTQLWEGKNLEFRGEFINAFNHVLLPAPNTTVTSAAFGSIVASNQSNYPRRIQLTLKFVF
ncbi:MAG TPA: TonB-dependent receptor [Blastocatellia bacterium]|nr:TonB-dependent receptor [Blastocatellia bacterium]